MADEKHAEGGQWREGDRWVKVTGTKVEPQYQPGEQPFGNNMVITSSYTWWNFIPKNLLEQFSNLANLYFLFIGILQIIPWISTTKGIPTMYQPLAFIVVVSAIRAIMEDLAKHKSDAKRNDYKYQVWADLGDGKFGWKPCRSGDLEVGHLLMVKQNEMIPADLLFIGSALQKGHCFIDKANLNGETTLEVLSSLKETRPFCPYDEKWRLSDLHCDIHYEPPNKKFDKLRGILVLFGSGRPATGDSGGQEITVDGKVLLMRETTLRNCGWVIGIVLYNGNDTKIQKSNSEGGKPKLKTSKIMRLVNRYLIGMLLLQTGLCLFGGIYAGIWRDKKSSELWYFGEYDSWQTPGMDGFLAFFSWFILLSQMVPISLIVSGEIVKTIQTWFIEWDIALYYPPIDKPAKVNSSTHHEDLGLVDYVFSDKTGTLTQNKMTFRYALLTTGEFGSKETEIARSVKQKNQELADRLSGLKPKDVVPWTKRVAPLIMYSKDESEKDKDCCERKCFRWWLDIWVDYKSEDARRKRLQKESESSALNANEFTEQERLALLKALWGKEQDPKLRRDLHIYMRHMALSNTVKPYYEKKKDDEKGVEELKFQSESAEESAMVAFAQRCGFTKTALGPSTLVIQEFSPTDFTKPIGEITETYEHVATFGFTSKRARVTVIYRDITEDKIHVMVKGQDTVLLPLLAKHPNESDLFIQLKNMGANGLRTLVSGYAIQPREWWEGEREEKYKKAITMDETEFSEGHPDKCDKTGRCEKCYTHDLFNQFEIDAQLKFLGCIGLEDQLQLLVPETIQDCLRAGVKVWMITGDKLDTAKNIGLATNLIDSDMQPQLSSEDTVDESIAKIQKSRLIEITGAWAELGKDREALDTLFQMFDRDNNGEIDQSELKDILMKLGLPDNVLKNSENMIESLTRDRNGALDKEQFIKFITNARMTPYDAVAHDLTDGLKIYKSIDDHKAEPVSILVNRNAFEVMFPGKTETQSGAEDDINEEKLEKLRKKFFYLAANSKSVVFARAQPAMKKKMVTEIMGRYPNAITLAIGDGANDTDMITAAHVGVGIAGVEGTAATNSADYAIGTFRMLHTLLFVHGFWSYQRIADLVNFIFYKASLVAMTGYYFGFYSGFSGQQFYNDPIYQFYNVVFTALPVLIVAIWDQKLPRRTLEDNPAAFREAKHKAFNLMVFGGWILRAFIHSIILFFIPVYACGFNDVLGAEGRVHGLWYTSTVVYFGVVLVPTFLIIYSMLSITILHVLAISLSVLALFVICFMASIFLSLNSDLYGIMAELYSDPLAWLTMIVSVAIPMILEMIYRGVKRDLRPSLTEILQERIYLVNKNKPKDSKPPTALKADPDEPGPGKPLVTTARGEPTQKRSSMTATPGDTLSHHDEEIFMQRKPHRQKGPVQHTAEDLRVLSRQDTFSEASSKEKDTAIQGAVISAMLRFRSNITGSQFDSAAQAKYQQHDVMGGKSEKKSSRKHDDVDEYGSSDSEESKTRGGKVTRKLSGGSGSSLPRKKTGGGKEEEEGDSPKNVHVWKK